ncbi:MAG: aminotransferase class I/II-fold pyridoxal phosphate-dependent enzyme [Pseudomonadota bacterium]|jgi:aspartate/methionine/tyrosine aminotransferase
MKDFPRIKRLPPYVFNITAELKMAARRQGEDIIDMSMGNPDGPTPRHIVDKLVEAAGRGTTHGYSVSKGIPRLRRAICDWYRRRYGVEFDPESEAVVTIGSKEGLAHLMLATLDRGDTVLVPDPSYPIHIYGAIIAGADIPATGRRPSWKSPVPYRELGSLEFAKKLLAEAKVAVSPGVGFGEYGDDHVRFALIENEERIRQAVRGIKDMFRKDGLL